MTIPRMLSCSWLSPNGCSARVMAFVLFALRKDPLEGNIAPAPLRSKDSHAGGRIHDSRHADPDDLSPIEPRLREELVDAPKKSRLLRRNIQPLMLARPHFPSSSLPAAPAMSNVPAFACASSRMPRRASSRSVRSVMSEAN
jgi:hypothetical protein